MFHPMPSAQTRLPCSRGMLLIVLLLLMYGLTGCSTKHPGPMIGPPLDNTAWLATLEAPQSLLHALHQGQVEFMETGDNEVVPVRVFGGSGKLRPILFTHGLQSHSGWFAQSAAFLARLGHPVYAMDRRGSGLSPAPRGHIDDFQEWSHEIDRVAQNIMARHGYDRFFLVGHCFGAIPATVYAINHPEHLQGLILTTPAIYTITSIPLPDMLRILFSTKEARDFTISSPLTPESFTELTEYQQFISKDPLALRETTGQFYWQVYQARKYITANVQQLESPLLMVLAGQDPISDNSNNRKFFAQVPAREKTLTEFTAPRHILEYSPEQHEFFHTLARWLTNR